MNITALLADKPAKTGAVKFIGIDGHGASGKTSLAIILAKQLNAEIIHTDDFASHDVPFAWSDKIIEAVFAPIVSGAKLLNYPRSKWWANHTPQPVINQPITPIMIIEGVGALRHELRPFLSLAIFVDTPTDICLTRGLARDKDNGNSIDEVKQLWQNWLKAETTYMQRHSPKFYADIVIDGTRQCL